MWNRLLPLASALLVSYLPSPAAAENWPQFRGPHASGVSADPAPVTWNVATGENIRWQTPVPGLAHSSPIVWGDHLFVTTAVKAGPKGEVKIGLYGSGDSFSEKVPHQWRLLCLDKASGKVLWNNLGLEAVPRLERHTKATQCNSTPATDGRRIAATFGSEGLYVFDMKGHRLWHQDLGKLHAGPYDAPTMQWGCASSPILYDGKVIVQCDTLSEQYLAAFDAESGRELWRTPRSEVSTWCTPLIANSPGRTQVIINGWKHIGGYDLTTGKELWRLKEGGDVPVASPILWTDHVILTSGHGKYRPMRAVRLDASGDISPSEMGETNKSLIWCQPRKGNYLQTPIAIGNLLWGCSNDGIVTCFEAATGTIHYEERIGGGGQGFTASPVSAGGKLYYTGEQGDVFVLPATKEFSVLATNKLGGICLATAAVSDRTLYYRTTDNLIAISKKNQ